MLKKVWLRGINLVFFIVIKIFPTASVEIETFCYLVHSGNISQSILVQLVFNIFAL